MIQFEIKSSVPRFQLIMKTIFPHLTDVFSTINVSMASFPNLKRDFKNCWPSFTMHYNKSRTTKLTTQNCDIFFLVIQSLFLPKLQADFFPSGSQSTTLSSKRVSWSGGRGLKGLCVKIGYSEPPGAESWEGSSTLAESFWVTYYSILIGCWLGNGNV